MISYITPNNLFGTQLSLFTFGTQLSAFGKFIKVIYLGLNCRGTQLSRDSIVAGLNCRGTQLSRDSIVAGLNCRGTQLSRDSIVAGLNCRGTQLTLFAFGTQLVLGLNLFWDSICFGTQSLLHHATFN